MENLEVKLSHDRTTKNTYRFITDEGPITALYIAKWAFPDTVPNAIILTVENDDA